MFHGTPCITNAPKQTNKLSLCKKNSDFPISVFLQPIVVDSLTYFNHKLCSIKQSKFKILKVTVLGCKDIGIIKFKFNFFIQKKNLSLLTYKLTFIFNENI